MDSYKNPATATDAIIIDNGMVLLIKRKHEPLGYALPGGFINEGESAYDACIREIKEETNLDAVIWQQFHTYSAPERDPRKHVLSIVHICTCTDFGMLRSGDDADAAEWFCESEIPWDKLVFDHAIIITDYLNWKRSGTRPLPTL